MICVSTTHCPRTTFIIHFKWWIIVVAIGGSGGGGGDGGGAVLVFVFVFVTFIQLTFAMFRLLGQAWAEPSRPKNIFVCISLGQFSCDVAYELAFTIFGNPKRNNEALYQLMVVIAQTVGTDMHAHTHYTYCMHANGCIDVCSMFILSSWHFVNWLCLVACVSVRSHTPCNIDIPFSTPYSKRSCDVFTCVSAHILALMLRRLFHCRRNGEKESTKKSFVWDMATQTRNQGSVREAQRQYAWACAICNVKPTHMPICDDSHLWIWWNLWAALWFVLNM